MASLATRRGAGRESAACRPIAFRPQCGRSPIISNAPSGKGALAGWPHTGAAGGAACGDLVRIALRIEGDAVVAEAGFDAEGCGAVTAAASAVVELVEGGRSRGGRITPDDVADALGGLTPPSATRPSSPPTRCTARSAPAAKDGARGLPRSPGGRSSP